MTAGLLVVLAAPAHAQLETSLDVGAASVTYQGGYRTSAMSVTPTLSLISGRASVLATGSLSRFETGGHLASGMLGGSVLSSTTSPLRGEIAVVAGGSAPGEGSRTDRWSGQLRLHLLSHDRGLWLGGGAGQAGITGARHGTMSAEAGGWWRARALLFIAAVEPARVGDSSWVDARGGARWDRGALALGATAGVRSGADFGARSWQSVDATWWLNRFVAFNAAAGSYLADPMQLAPGGRFLTIGLRVATHRAHPDVLAELRRSGRRPLLATPVADGIEIRAVSDGRRLVVIQAPVARTVELMGDFTEWQPVSLVRARDGRWTLSLPIAAGTHRFNIRVDGGDWSVPRGVTTITDDFEGVVGIISVK